MKWKYHIPHIWDKPTDRTVWEDVYLMPALGWENKEEKMSAWLTVDALRKKPTGENPDEMEDYQDALKKLKNHDYVIDRDLCSMIVRTEDFNMEELLGYAKIFIKEIFNDEDIVLVEGTFEDFVGTHEILARAIHESYRDRQEEKGETRETNASMVPWDQLPENLKESNRRQADHIGIKLKAIGCSIAPMTDWDAKPFKFSKEEIDLMARMEHERWMSERLQAGWTFKEKEKNIEKKTSPDLVPTEKLTEDAKELDQNPVEDLPIYLAKVGFQIYRLNKEIKEWR